MNNLKITILIELDGVNLSYSKLLLFDVSSRIQTTTSGCKEIIIRKVEFVASNNFL